MRLEIREGIYNGADIIAQRRLAEIKIVNQPNSVHERTAILICCTRGASCTARTGGYEHMKGEVGEDNNMI